MKNNKSLASSLIAMLLFSFVLSPAFAMAKDNNGNGKGNSNKDVKVELKAEFKENKSSIKSRESEDSHENEKEDDNEDHEVKVDSNRSQNKCWRALGHLVAPGWIKNNGFIDIGQDCYLPFGIAKKIRGGGEHSTSTPDTTAPVISNISATSTHNQAIVTWKTDENSNSVVFYQTSNSVDTESSTTPRITINNSVKNHSVTLTGLSASTTYFFKVVSKDPSGNSSTSTESSFTTKETPVVVDNEAPVISTIVTVVGTSTANVIWGTNEPATSKVYYSTSTPLDINAPSTNFVESASTTESHIVYLSGLSTSTTYYLVVESRDTSLNIKMSDEFSLTTSN